MADKISGADLQVGQTIKAHGRLYKIHDIEEPDDIGTRLADVELTDGSFVTMNFFDDSEYELRHSPARRRIRMVKVRAADLELVLSTDKAIMTIRDELEAAVARLKAAIK